MPFYNVVWMRTENLISLLFPPQVILASGYYAAFRVTLVAKALEGMYDGAIHITTDYEVGQHCGGCRKQIRTCIASHSLRESFLDINNPSESAHRSGDFKQLSQTHHFATFISSK